LDVLSDQVSIFGARSALEAGPFDLKRVLLGSAADALLAGGDADRHRRNRLQTRAASIALTRALANTEIRQTRLPPSQSVLLTQCGAIIGNCSLTTGGLGTAPQSQLGFVQTTENDTELAMVSQWFETEWNAADPKGMAVEALVSSITAAAADHAPGAVYIQALHQLFAEMQVGTDESRIVDSATGIRETQVWSKLYRFQKDGVIGAIDKLQRFGGCIIADSVGLGKTFEALAVIKYFELRNARVLVLAPKRLRENWTLWRRNDVRNILAADRFAFDVLNHTDLSRESGLSGDVDLGHINWANYDLVVIDESHNFRNRPAGKGERESRYDRLLNAVVKAGASRCGVGGIFRAMQQQYRPRGGLGHRQRSAAGVKQGERIGPRQAQRQPCPLPEAEHAKPGCLDTRVAGQQGQGSAGGLGARVAQFQHRNAGTQQAFHIGHGATIGAQSIRQDQHSRKGFAGGLIGQAE
jgi:hypothetical protein